MRRLKEISKPKSVNQYPSTREIKEGRRNGILTSEDIYRIANPDSKLYRQTRNDLIKRGVIARNTTDEIDYWRP